MRVGFRRLGRRIQAKQSTKDFGFVSLAFVRFLVGTGVEALSYLSHFRDVLVKVVLGCGCFSVERLDSNKAEESNRFGDMVLAPYRLTERYRTLRFFNRNG